MPVLAVIFILVSLNADDLKEGEKLFSQKGCYACHGIDAKGNSSYPSLAGREVKYIVDRLENYKKERIKSQRSDIMTSYAKNLTKEEMKKIAIFIHSLKDNKEEGEEFFEDSLYESD